LRETSIEDVFEAPAKTWTAKLALFHEEVFFKFVAMITKFNNLKLPIAVVFLFFFLAGDARAHDPGLSAINVRLGPAEISVQLSVARSDLENALKLHAQNGQQNTEHNSSAAPQFEAFGRAALELRIDDQPLSVRSVGMHSEDSGSVVYQIVYEYKPGVRLRVLSHTLKLLARGHRQYISIEDDRGNKLSEKMLDSTDCQLDAEVSSTKREGTLLQFVALGIEHILTGYDHLVFLLGLLIAGTGFKDITRIITSFTAAHSITLALSTLDFVRISPALVEPLIAISIVYVGLENILRRDLKWRWLLTFAFGLVHGFGFASALRDVGIGSGSAVALPLVSFNVGVELGQLSVALVALPIIWRLRRRQMFVTRLAPACSVIIGIAGMAWLVERLAGL